MGWLDGLVGTRLVGALKGIQEALERLADDSGVKIGRKQGYFSRNRASADIAGAESASGAVFSPSDADFGRYFEADRAYRAEHGHAPPDDFDPDTYGGPAEGALPQMTITYIEEGAGPGVEEPKDDGTDPLGLRDEQKS